MLVIAHRGANREFPQNTPAAYRAAIDGGADRIEIDVQLSAAGSAVLAHDDEVKGADGGVLYISRSTDETIKSFPGAAAGSCPFLNDVLSEFVPLIEFNIEVKGDDLRAAAAVLDAIVSARCRERVVISSFFPNQVRFFAERAPDIRRACLVGSMERWTWDQFQQFMPQAIMGECRASTIHPHAYRVNGCFMDQARHYGWEVVPWVPMAGEAGDREELWQRMLSYGVGGLCTNYPRELRQWLMTRTSR